MDGRAGNRSHPRDVSPDVLIATYTPLICMVARQAGFTPTESPSNSHGMEWDDVMQAGRIALWLCVDKFDPNLVDEKHGNDPFVPYATTKIRQELSNEWRRNQWSPGCRHRDPMILEHREFWDMVSVTDPWAQLEAQEYLDLIDAAIKKQDIKRRNVFQGVMREGTIGRPPACESHCQALGISKSRIYQYKHDIRKRLRKELN